MTTEQPFNVQSLLIATPRGACGGVNMAHQTITEVLRIVAKREPVRTNFKVVNNDLLVKEMKDGGLVIDPDPTLLPPNSIYVFSAHGVSPQFRQEAAEMGHLLIDTTCKLVSNVHRIVTKKAAEGFHIGYIGADGHPETTGVIGEVDPENITLIDAEKFRTMSDQEQQNYLKNLPFPKDKPIIVYNQTTLGMSDLDKITTALPKIFTDLTIPPRSSICYATDHRQTVARELVKRIDALVVVGTKTRTIPGTNVVSRGSHNSEELRRIGEAAGIPSYLVDEPDDLELPWFRNNINTVGLTSGASVLERFFVPVVEWFQEKNPNLSVSEIESSVKEDPNLTFTLPQKQIDLLRARYL